MEDKINMKNNIVEINEEILKKYGIYKTRTLKENEEQELLKIKKEIEKIIKMTVERLYVINESAWGKDAQNEKYSICILVDKRIKDLTEARELLIPYCKKKNIIILFWTLCQFEKRKNAPTEEDYYINQYGIKVYDSQKQPEINENLEATEYAAHMQNYRSLQPYIHDPDWHMQDLVRIYTLKIGYAVIGREADLKRDCDFAKMVSKDEKAIKIIDKYLEQTEEKEKYKIANEFRKYLNNVKQVKFQMRLKEKPTMDVYERLLKKKEKQGFLDIKTLTKEDLYTMYIIQKKYTDEIADLYGVENKKILAKRGNWNIKVREGAFLDDSDIIEKVIDSTSKRSQRYAYALLKKTGIMKFEECALPILKYMIDDNVYLLKEFWQFTKNKKENVELMIYGNIQDSYYRASMCLELLLQNDLVEEVDFKQYKITKKGKELVWYCNINDIDQINIPIICKHFGKVNYYNLYYIEEYPTQVEEVTWEKLYKKWQEYSTKRFPELLQKDKIPVDISSKQIENEEEIALIWMYLFFVNLKWRNIYPKQWEETIFISAKDILEPIQKKIRENEIEIIVNEKMQFNKFMDISNLCKYIKIKNVEDIVEYAASSCAYMIKNIEG